MPSRLYTHDFKTTVTEYAIFIILSTEEGLWSYQQAISFTDAKDRLMPTT